MNEEREIIEAEATECGCDANEATTECGCTCGAEETTTAECGCACGTEEAVANEETTTECTCAAETTKKKSVAGTVFVVIGAVMLLCQFWYVAKVISQNYGYITEWSDLIISVVQMTAPSLILVGIGLVIMELSKIAEALKEK